MRLGEQLLHALEDEVELGPVLAAHGAGVFFCGCLLSRHGNRALHLGLIQAPYMARYAGPSQLRYHGRAVAVEAFHDPRLHPCVLRGDLGVLVKRTKEGVVCYRVR